MSNIISGRLHKVYDTKQVTEKFRVREFVVLQPFGDHDQFITFKAIQDGCDKLNNVAIGADVKVTYKLGGREYTKDGVTKYFNSIECTYLEVSSEAVQKTQQREEPVPAEGDDSDLPF